MNNTKFLNYQYDRILLVSKEDTMNQRRFLDDETVEEGDRDEISD